MEGTDIVLLSFVDFSASVLSTSLVPVMCVLVRIIFRCLRMMDRELPPWRTTVLCSIFIYYFSVQEVRYV